MHIPTASAQVMRKLPTDKKILLIKQYKESQQKQADQHRQGLLNDTPEFACHTCSASPTLPNLQHVRMLITYQSANWINKFIELKGVSILFQLVSSLLGPRQCVIFCILMKHVIDMILDQL